MKQLLIHDDIACLYHRPLPLIFSTFSHNGHFRVIHHLKQLITGMEKNIKIFLCVLWTSPVNSFWSGSTKKNWLEIVQSILGTVKMKHWLISKKHWIRSVGKCSTKHYFSHNIWWSLSVSQTNTTTILIAYNTDLFNLFLKILVIMSSERKVTSDWYIA